MKWNLEKNKQNLQLSGFVYMSLQSDQDMPEDFQDSPLIFQTVYHKLTTTTPNCQGHRCVKQCLVLCDCWRCEPRFLCFHSHSDPTSHLSYPQLLLFFISQPSCLPLLQSTRHLIHATFSVSGISTPNFLYLFTCLCFHPWV